MTNKQVEQTLQSLRKSEKISGMITNLIEDTTNSQKKYILERQFEEGSATVFRRQVVAVSRPVEELQVQRSEGDLRQSHDHRRHCCSGVLLHETVKIRLEEKMLY